MKIDGLLANATEFTTDDIRQMIRILDSHRELVDEATAPQVFMLHWFQRKEAVEVLLGRDTITAIDCCGGLVEAIIAKTNSDRRLGIIDIPNGGPTYLVFDGGTSVHFRQEVLEQIHVTDVDLVRYKSDMYKYIISLFKGYFEGTADREVLPFTDNQDQHLERLFQCWINCRDLAPEVKSEIKFWSEPENNTPKKCQYKQGV